MSQQRLPGSRDSAAPHTDKTPPAPGPQTLDLQRVIGNQALQRLISSGGALPAGRTAHVALRTPGGAAQRLQRDLAGLSAAASVESFAQEAVTFCRSTSNAAKPLTDLAGHLMTKVNDSLKTIPSYECAHTFSTTGTTGAFSGGSFSIDINTAAFSERSGVTKVGDLNQAEIAEIVDTIYHEARHSEQYFRVARTLAGQGKTAAEIATQVGIPNIVAAEAFKNPLANTTANAGAIAEAESWKEFIGRGKYVAYKVMVANLRDSIAPARAKLTSSDRPGFKTELAKITTIMTGKVGPLLTQVEGLSTKTPADTLVLTDATAIKTAYDEVTGLDADTASLATLRSKMLALHNARYQAYRNYPHEQDAWARGGEAGAKYKELDTIAATPPPVTTPPVTTPEETTSSTETTTPPEETTSSTETTTPPEQSTSSTETTTPPEQSTSGMGPPTLTPEQITSVAETTSGSPEQTTSTGPTEDETPTQETPGETPEEQEEETAKKLPWYKKVANFAKSTAKKVKGWFK